ncbi:MAG: 16S rRNA (cytidine(1402)-2'-O)-methyltransferase [Desulfovibrionaceae bacterium]
MPLNSPQLWIVATPLGNPGDLSPRAREVLESVDIVLAEDTRRAGLLFQRCGLRAQRFISFHDHNEDEKSQGIVRLLREGQHAALISDAGTPLMADPGYRLVRACREAGLRVSMIPGPCAPVAALSAAGIAPQPFTFLGFLPRDTRGQEKLFGAFARVPSTLIFFERKDRLSASLATAYAQLGPREICIARELTKAHEAFILTRLEKHAQVPTDLLGEITVIIGPPEAGYRTPQAEVERLLHEQHAQGGKGRDIARRVQEHVSGWTGKELYQMLQK